MGGPIDMNVGMCQETFVDLLKSMVLQLFSKYSQRNVNLNVKIQLPIKSKQVDLVFSIWV